MLDAVAVNFVRLAVERELDGVQCFTQRLIADGVDGELKAFGVGVAAFLFQIVGVVDAQAAGLRVIGVRFGEPGGLRAK